MQPINPCRTMFFSFSTLLFLTLSNSSIFSSACRVDGKSGHLTTSRLRIDEAFLATNKEREIRRGQDCRLPQQHGTIVNSKEGGNWRDSRHSLDRKAEDKYWTNAEQGSQFKQICREIRQDDKGISERRRWREMEVAR